MSANRVLGGVEATLAMAGIAFKRMLRGKALWVVAAMGVLPFLFTLPMENPTVAESWQHVVEFWGFLLAILPPVLLASAIGEEIEERTMTYLWSRPLPRWSIVAGKVLAILPVLWIVLAASLALPFYTRFPDAGAHGETFARTMVACVFGTIGVSAVTAGLATLVPRHGTVVALAVLTFVDRPIALFKASISKLSVIHHSQQLSGAGEILESIPEAIGWLLGLSAVWLGIAVWRIRRLE